MTRKQRLAYPVGDVYRALADPTRRVLLDELVGSGGQTLFELCARLATKHGIGSTRQAVSQHLAVLEEAGLVRSERDGRTKLHWFDGTPLRAIAERWPVPEKKRKRCRSTSPASSSTTSRRRSVSTPRSSAS